MENPVPEGNSVPGNVNPSVEVDLTTKFPVIHASQMKLPAKCHSCGAVTPDRLYVDIKLHVNRHGSIYVCVWCMTTIAESLGYVDNRILDQMSEAFKALTARNEKLVFDLEAARNVVTGILSLYPAYPDSGDDLFDKLLSSFRDEQAAAFRISAESASGGKDVPTGSGERSASVRRAPKPESGNNAKPGS